MNLGQMIFDVIALFVQNKKEVQAELAFAASILIGIVLLRCFSSSILLSLSVSGPGPGPGGPRIASMPRILSIGTTG